MSGETRIRDLGALNGPLLLFGGPCSNLQASLALLAEAESRRIGRERRICTGDVVAYGADPAVCFDLWSAEAELVAGNCERQLAAGAPDCGCGFAAGSTCDRLSRGWYPFAAAKIGARQRAAMAALPDLLLFRHRGRRHAVIHGGLTDIARYLWPVSPDAAFAEEIAAIEALAGPVDAVIAGHCGIAFQREIGRVRWINAGSIGLPPHDGAPQTRYVLLEGGRVRFMRLDYDAAAARAAMERAGLAQGYERTLTDGWWPSEEVLPPPLRRAARDATRGAG